MEMLVWFIGIFFIAELLGIHPTNVLGCFLCLLFAFLVYTTVSSVAWYWIALWGVLVIPLGVGVCSLLDQFFPMDETGKRVPQKRPFPVAVERPDKFVLPTATDASDGFEPPDDLDG